MLAKKLGVWSYIDLVSNPDSIPSHVTREIAFIYSVFFHKMCNIAWDYYKDKLNYL